ncbi:GGDEF domain-containing protein [Teredinibacter turnerae]|uniref:GGDEF domain-containing protein n=1 Tax=Teredinibacter turnerae TaxID=2426 RepID=UPI0005F77744|nr:GGDEF domain-containing protein [Teredinibacter turnerae]
MSFQSGISKRLNASAFAPQARRATLTIHVIAFAVTVTFSLHHLVFDSLLIGCFATLSALGCSLSTLALFHGKPRAINYYVFFLFQYLALTGTCYQYGLRGIVLIYPITAALFYILTYKHAYFLALIFFVSGMVASINHFPLDMLLRISVALLTSIIISGGFAYVVEQQRARLAYDANHDELTRILNRRGFITELEKKIRETAERRQEIGLFFIDLNKFKAINDNFGHHVGDEVLRVFAHRVSGTLRTEISRDQHPTPYYFGRFSGDEFVIAYRLTNKAQAGPIGERLLSVCNSPIKIGDTTIELKISVGVCFASTTGYDADALIRKADEGMYVAKARNSDSVYICD